MFHYSGRQILLLTVLLYSLTGCASFDYPAPLVERADSVIEQELSEVSQSIASPVHLLGQGDEALLARLAMISHARNSIDLQVYIFKADRSGATILAALLQAAERGVKVRLLLDDFGTGQQDQRFASLNSHPNITVKLFNPSQLRQLPLTSILFDFSLKSRRMHNKLMISDQQFAILGGRNIGDMYFDSATTANFHDLDIILSDKAAQPLTRSFELYWQHPLAVAMADINTSKNAAGWQALAAELAATRPSSAELAAIASYYQLNLAPLSTAAAVTTHIVVDHPDKLLHDVNKATAHLVPVMQQILQDVQHSALIISPYFVPKTTLYHQLSQWVAAGSEVEVLTNSLAATDVMAVHAGYAPWLERLLGAGIQLWEFKPDPAQKQPSHSILGSSRASLHAKTFVFDQRYVFIGSLNLDPRSVNLNTELGIILDAPSLAQAITTGIKQQLKSTAYQLSYTADAKQCQLQWLEWDPEADQVKQHYCHDPQVKSWQRWFTEFLSLLPIQNQL